MTATSETTFTNFVREELARKAEDFVKAHKLHPAAKSDFFNLILEIASRFQSSENQDSSEEVRVRLNKIGFDLTEDNPDSNPAPVFTGGFPLEYTFELLPGEGDDEIGEMLSNAISDLTGWSVDFMEWEIVSELV